MENARPCCPSTTREALRWAAERLAPASANPRLDAELLLRHVLGDRDKAWLLTHPDHPLAPEQAALYAEWITRRAGHEPIQYILGSTEFYGLRLQVSPAVLIPRPETEHLVEAVLERAPRDQSLHIADVGTGSGAIAIALAAHLPHARIDALDLSPEAIAVAQANARAHSLTHLRFLHSDLLSAVAGERYDIIVSNPPYIAADEPLEPQVAQYEPHTALFAGTTGLEVYRRLIPASYAVLAPRGLLALELGAGQASAIARILAEQRVWEEPLFVRDLQGIERVALARLAS